MRKTLFFILIVAVILSAVLVGCNETATTGDKKIDIVEENVTIKKIGDTIKLTVKNAGSEIVWSSADEDIATVSSDGTVTAVANGVTEITATSGGAADTCVVVVDQAVIAEPGLSVTLSKTSATLSAINNETYTIKATIKKNNQEISGATISWTSSDNSKVTVSDSGLIKAISNTDSGNPVVITCKVEYNGEWAEAKFFVTVKDDTDIVFLNEKSTFYTTDSEILLPVSVKINGVNHNGTPTYSSSDSTIAKVENNKIIPVGTGKVTIYATINGESKGCEITLRQKIFVDTAEKFLNIGAGNENITYELTKDIVLGTDDFVLENIGGTGVKTQRGYLIESFKGELIGNGYTVKYVYDAKYDGENFNPVTIAGLFYTIEETASIKETVFIGELTVDYPHMYSFASYNYGTIENCYIHTSRRQVAKGTGWNNHYNTAGGVFSTQAGTVRDTIVYASFYAGATATADSGDNLVMYGAQGVGTYENVAFVSNYGRIGNHAGANWNKGMYDSELVKLVYYKNMDDFVLKDGQQVTNPNNEKSYSKYVKTACSDQTFDDDIWTITENTVSLRGKMVYESIRITSNYTNITFVENMDESVQLKVDVNQDEKEFTFSSTNEDVATVTEDGLVEFAGIGSANIIVKHNATGVSISISVKAVGEATKIATASDLKEYAETATEDSLAYLTANIVFDEADIIEDETSRYFIDTFSGMLDGKGYTISYEYNVADGNSFAGLIKTVNSGAIIKNAVIKGSFSTQKTGGRALFTTLKGTIEDCYIEVYREQREGSGNNQLTGSIIGTQSGTIRNSVINASGIVGDGTIGSKGLPMQNTGSGIYENVAFISAEKSIGWRTNGVYGTTINSESLINYRYYMSMAEFAQGIGYTIKGNEETSARYDYTFTLEEDAQNLGTMFEVKGSEYSEKVSYNGKMIWSRKSVGIQTKESFLKYMRESDDSTVLKLLTDLEFTTEDFIKVDNGSTKVKNKNIYLINTFNGVLFGGGHTIKWHLDDTASIVGENTVSESSVKGFINVMTETARIFETHFVGESVVDADGQAAFITEMRGEIDSCILDITRRQTKSSSGNWQSTGGIFHKNEGVISNCIIIANGATSKTGAATRGAKLVYGGTINGIFENIALIQPDKNVGTRNGANKNSYIYDSQLVDVVWYDSVERFVLGIGEKVTNEGNDDEFEYTKVYQIQDLGDSINVTKEKIKLINKTIWSDDKITTTTESIDLTQDLYESETIKMYVDGEDSTAFTFKSSNESVVTVSASGEVTFVGVGEAVITVTYKVDGQQITIPVTTRGSSPIGTAAQLIAISGSGADVYAYLTADITLTESDAGENTSFIPTFGGLFDGRGYKITFTYGEGGGKTFNGLFGEVTGTVENLNVVGKATTNADYGSAFIGNLASGAKVENSYVEISLDQTASSSGNWSATKRIIGTNNGTVENVLFNVVGTNSGSSAAGFALQSNGTGSVYKNVAVVMPSKANAWRNGVYNNKLSQDQLDNVVYYASMGDFVAANGEVISSANNTFSYTAITMAQNISSSFAVDTTLYNENVKFSNKVVWQREIIEVDTKSEFITAMKNASDATVVKLTGNLTFETTDFTKETESNGSTTYKYDMYVIETFKGILLGNQKTITYTFSPEDASDIRLRGFFEKVESTAKVIGVKIVGTVDIPYSFQTAFAEANYGVFDSCYIDVKATMQNWDSNSYNTIGLFGRNDGYIQNSILVIDAKRSNQTAWQGMKITHNGSDSSAGRIVNVALIQTAKRIGTRNNANPNSYIKNEQLSNLVYYSSLANFLAGTGELVTNESNDGTFEYTAITSTQNIGSAWTVDSTGIKLNGTYVYEVTAE